MSTASFRPRRSQSSNQYRGRKSAVVPPVLRNAAGLGGNLGGNRIDFL